MPLRVDLLAAAVNGDTYATGQNEITKAGNLRNLYKDAENLFEKIITELEDGKDVFLKLNQLKQNKSNHNSLAGKIRVGFNDTRGDNLLKKLPDKIILQHDNIVKKCKADLRRIHKNLNQIDKTKKGVLKKKAKATKVHLKKNVFKKKYIPLDPKELPHPKSILKP